MEALPVDSAARFGLALGRIEAGLIERSKTVKTLHRAASAFGLWASRIHRLGFRVFRA